jgi:hypothetical protein
MAHFNNACTMPDTLINYKSFPDVNFHEKRLFLLNTSSGENFLPCLLGIHFIITCTCYHAGVCYIVIQFLMAEIIIQGQVQYM